MSSLQNTTKASPISLGKLSLFRSRNQNSWCAKIYFVNGASTDKQTGSKIKFNRVNGILTCTIDEHKNALACCFASYTSVRKLQQHSYEIHKHPFMAGQPSPRRSERPHAEKAPVRFDDRYDQSHVPQGNLPSNCLIDDDLLRSISCAVNPMCRIIICLLCSSAIPPDQLVNHSSLAKHRHHPKITDDDAALVVKKYNICPSENITILRGHVPPVEGLLVLEGGCQCQVCGRVLKETKTHMSREHPYELNRIWEKDCYYQQLFHNSRQYFRVYPTENVRNSENYFRSYLPIAAAALVLKPDLTPLVMRNRATTKGWPEVSGWPRAVEGYDCDLLLEMVSVSKDDCIMAALTSACQTFVAYMAESAQNANSDVRRWLLSCTRYDMRRQFDC